MFKQKDKILCIIIIVSFIAVNFIFAKPREEEKPKVFYNSPEDAIETEYKSTNYVLVESNGVVFIVCTTDNKYGRQYILKNNDGWYVATDSVIRNSILSKYDKSGLYGINAYKYMDKYFICIDQDELSINKYGLLNVTDSVGSQFEETEFDTQILNSHYWFLCLETLPDDYFVKINDTPAN